MKIGKHVFAAFRVLALTVVATHFAVSAALAQETKEITPEHLAAAKAAMSATGATSRLDKILPELAEFTKTGLIANRPDIEAEISSVVDDVAISLAPRRGPLEDEVAKIYTKLFSQEELEIIQVFFTSEAGNKFLNLTPALFQELDKAAKVWRTGLTRDMNEMVREKLKEANLQ